MKNFFLTLASGALCLTLSAQAPNEASTQVESSIAQVETISEVYGIMVARLDEVANESYTSGSAEISYDELIERLEASTEEITVNSGDEEVTVVLGPSVTRLDDNHGSAPPALLANESALDYLLRLEEMVANSAGNDEFLVVATTGGEFGIAYTRVQSRGANNINEEGSISVALFPNPTTDQVTITGLPAGNHNGQILDAAGKVVMEVSVSENEQVDFGNLASGFYTLKLLVEGEFHTEKFQIKK